MNQNGYLQSKMEHPVLKNINSIYGKLPVGRSSIFLEAKSIRCKGLTIVIDLQDTARVRIFSPKTKKGTGNWIASRVQFTLDF